MDTIILEQIGLSKNEIKLYFALLELDQSSATPIIKISGIPNSKFYPTIEKLIKKGLCSYVIKNNVKHFQISDPNNLIDFLNNKEKQITEQKQKIKELIPIIKQKRKLGQQKQEAEIYEGYEGVKTAFNSILTTLSKNQEYYVFTLGGELETKQLKIFFQNYHKKRIQKQINVKLIVNKEIKKTFSKYHKYKAMQIKYTDLKLPSGVFIFGNNVMTLVWGEIPTAFIITSKNNTDNYKEFFNEIWKTCDK